MAQDRSDPFPNLPRSGGIARQFGRDASPDRLARGAAQPPQPPRAAAPSPPGEDRGLRAAVELLREEVRQFREEIRALRELVTEGPRVGSEGPREGDAEGGEGDAEGPRRLSKKAAQMKRYRERRKAKREGAA